MRSDGRPPVAINGRGFAPTRYSVQTWSVAKNERTLFEGSAVHSPHVALIAVGFTEIPVSAGPARLSRLAGHPCRDLQREDRGARNRRAPARVDACALVAPGGLEGQATLPVRVVRCVDCPPDHIGGADDHFSLLRCFRKAHPPPVDWIAASCRQLLHRVVRSECDARCLPAGTSLDL